MLTCHQEGFLFVCFFAWFVIYLAAIRYMDDGQQSRPEEYGFIHHRGKGANHGTYSSQPLCRWEDNV